ncbi:MAG: DUF362 domain-containing protein [Candidatus Dojkabacteria bacterium]|nr:DUF362 domain-containing protein [Candidatus Dojkabacteria bacterium]
MTKPKVAVLRTKPETVLDDYEKLMQLADFEQEMPKDKEVILKDNISWHYPMPSANTTPWQLEGVARALKNANYSKVTCVQNQTVVTNAFKGEDLNKYKGVFKKYDIPVLFNFKKEDIKWEVYKPKAKMNVLDKIFPEGISIPEYFKDKSIVHLPTVKCHIYTTTTGAMKNAFGGLLTKRRHYTHTWIHETLVDLLAIQKEIHSGVFAVMDGTMSGNGPGPRTLIPEEKDVIIASRDQVAIDAVSAKMMGFDPMKIKYIKMAHEQGLGVGNPSEIDIVGDTDVAKENWKFEVGSTMHKKLAWLGWYGPTKFLQKLVFHTPIVNIPILWSEVYHDYYRWNVKEKGIFKNWMKNSKWGGMFAEYEPKNDIK